MGRSRIAAVGLPLILILAACSSGTAATTAPSTAGSVAPPSAAASGSVAASAAAGGDTVRATVVGSIGTVLVAGLNGMTVYTFSKDVKDSGTSACTGGCLTKWPALTVPAGATPSGGSGISGKLATITRADDGTLQVTYNGLPLYFFTGDTKPGDGNGVYANWAAVKP